VAADGNPPPTFYAAGLRWWRHKFPDFSAALFFQRSRQRRLDFGWLERHDFFAGQMKRLFSSPDSATLGLLGSRLESEGIDCEIRNETPISMYGAPFNPELWVLKDEDFAKARELLAAWRQPGPP
jgi:hypothetical protein